MYGKPRTVFGVAPPGGTLHHQVLGYLILNHELQSPRIAACARLHRTPVSLPIDAALATALFPRREETKQTASTGMFV